MDKELTEHKKRPYIWIYEYKDDETLIGATLIDDFTENLKEEYNLPHLSGDWFWKVNFDWKWSIYNSDTRTIEEVSKYWEYKDLKNG